VGTDGIIDPDPPGSIAEEVELRMAQDEVGDVGLVIIGLVRTFNEGIIFGMTFANEGALNIQEFPDVRDGSLKGAGVICGELLAPIGLKGDAVGNAEEP
jgi:hypothetical protein